MDDLYETLQVTPTAEPEVIEAAYRRLARKYHPDVYKGADAHLRMQRLNAAFEVLSDPARRAEYDRGRDSRSRSGQAPSGASDSSRSRGAEDVKRDDADRDSAPFLSLRAAIALAVMAVVIGATTLVASLLGSDEPESDSSVPGATSTRVILAPGALATVVKQIEGDAVWQPDLAAMASACNRDSVFLDPVRDKSCITQAMEATGAKVDAANFYLATGNFLVEFRETGNVDVGTIQAPWQNMNRPQTVLLNGSFGVMGLEALVPADWQRDPRYLTLALTQTGGSLLLWPEYATSTVEVWSE